MTESVKKYDLFISHASEDKDSLVRPLAILLERLSVKVWYDEFSLKLGDDLSLSIDRGLQGSRYGLLILSKSFLAKNWTDYEYRSLLSRQIDGERVLLPLWYGIDKEDVKQYSLYLAGIKALPVSLGNFKSVIPSVLQVVRPDIWREMRMRAVLRKSVAEGRLEVMKLSDIKKATTKQSKLSSQQIVRSKAVYYGIGKHLHKDFEEYVGDFELDVVPERELQTWEIMNVCYLEMLDRHPDATETERMDYFKLLLAFSYSMGGGFLPKTTLDEALIKELFELWEKNYYEF